jgi:hypothetical protein
VSCTAPLVNAEKRTDRGSWEQTSGAASPNDGELVMVREAAERHLLPMIFRASPIKRWESPDGARVFDFQYFEEWRRG